jgi:hypothetical protein
VDQIAKIAALLDRLSFNFSHDSLFDLYKRLTTLAAMGMRAIAVLQDTEARYHRLPTVNVEFVLDVAQPLPSTLTSREVTRDAVAKGILGVASLVEDVPSVLGILSVRSLYNMLNSIADFAGNAPLYGNEIDWMLAAIRAGNVAPELERRGAPVSHNEKVKCRRMYERIKTRITQAKVSDSGDGVTISRLNWVVLDGKLKRLEEGITTFPLE